MEYDIQAQRWIITQFSVSQANVYGYLQCIAVSKTSDPMGSYSTYAYSYGSSMNDYPKMGVWPDAYYVTYNMFRRGNSFQGAKVCAFDRAKMLAGAAAPTQQCFQLSTAYGGLLPSDLDGATQPPAGSPNYLLNYGSSSLQLWKFKVDWTTPKNTTLSGPTTLAVAPFTRANSVPQPGVTEQLDSLSDRLMYRLAYRNSGTAGESLVVNHSVNVSDTLGARAGIRWYELGVSNTNLSLKQQGTYAPDATNRWMGSIAQDKVGNMAVGYSVASSSVYPSIRYTGRQVGEAAGTLQAETSIINGGGSQTNNLTRWGDYSSMHVDPTDDCTFWFSTEYQTTTGSFNWSTYISSFKYPNCA